MDFSNLENMRPHLKLDEDADIVNCSLGKKQDCPKSNVYPEKCAIRYFCFVIKATSRFIAIKRLILGGSSPRKKNGLNNDCGYMVRSDRIGLSHKPMLHSTGGPSVYMQRIGLG